MTSLPLSRLTKCDFIGTAQALRFWTAERVSGMLISFMSLMQGTEMYNIWLRCIYHTFTFLIAHSKALHILKTFGRQDRQGLRDPRCHVRFV
jgi:hypothetical protein